MTDGITISIVKNQGITQAIKAHVDDLVKSGKATLTDDSISKSEWSAAIDELDKIYDAHKQATGETIFTGGKNRDDWHKNYVVKKAQQITFSAEEMDDIYKALGVVLKKEETAVVPEPVSTDTLVNKEPVVKDEAIADETEAAPVSEKKNSRKGLWGLLGLGVAALVGLGIFALTRGKGKKAVQELSAEAKQALNNVENIEKAEAMNKKAYKISAEKINESLGIGKKSRIRDGKEYEQLWENHLVRQDIEKLNAENAAQRAESNTIGEINHGRGTTESMTEKVYASVKKSEEICSKAVDNTKLLKISGDTYLVEIKSGGEVGTIYRQIGKGEPAEITDPVKRAKFVDKHFNEIFGTAAA